MFVGVLLATRLAPQMLFVLFKAVATTVEMMIQLFPELILLMMSTYVDGLSLTHGHPKKHIWTFAAAINDVDNIPVYMSLYSSRSVSNCHSCIRWNDYSCDTGNHGTSWINDHFYGDDPLWDGAGCGVTGTCCSFNTPPWFTKQLPSSTDDPIELRNCGDQGLGNENIGIKLLEVYVQLVCFWSFS